MRTCFGKGYKEGCCRDVVVGSFYGYEAQGLFKDAADVAGHALQLTSTKPGDIKYKDQNIIVS